MKGWRGRPTWAHGGLPLTRFLTNAFTIFASKPKAGRPPSQPLPLPHSLPPSPLPSPPCLPTKKVTGVVPPLGSRVGAFHSRCITFHVPSILIAATRKQRLGPPAIIPKDPKNRLITANSDHSVAVQEPLMPRFGKRSVGKTAVGMAINVRKQGLSSATPG